MKEILENLNDTPVFTLTDAEQHLITSSDPTTSETFVPFIIDGPAAVKRLHENADVGAKLIAQSLGDVFAVLAGWSSSPFGQPGMPTYGTLTGSAEGDRLYAESIAGTPKEAEMAARRWTVPVFYCRALFDEEANYFFFSHEDLAVHFDRRREQGRVKGEMEQGCIELMDLAEAMLRGDAEWQLVHFRGPSSAQVALEALQAAPPAGPDDAPPLDEAVAATTSSDVDATMPVQVTEAERERSFTLSPEEERARKANATSLPAALIVFALVGVLVAAALGFFVSGGGDALETATTATPDQAGG